MNATLSQRLDRLARNLVPAGLGLVCVLLSVTPLYLPGYGMIGAHFAMMAVFYWAVHRPDLLSPLSVFGLGLLLDILVGTPHGVNALVLMMVRVVGDTQGRVFRGKSFLLLWCGFGLVALGASVVIWVLSAALALAPLDPRPALFQAAMTTALFPFLGGMFAWTQQRLLPQV